MLKFKVSKLKSTMEMSVWEKKVTGDTVEIVNKAILEIAPALVDAPKGQPKAGEKRYDYAKKVKISFNPTDMLKVAYNLIMMSYGNEIEYKKMGDASRANANSSGIKSLSIKLNDKGSIAISLNEDKDGAKSSVFIYLEKDEAYALAKWFEVTYTKLYNNPDASEDE
jgi:glutamate formiminotransferase